MYVKFLDKDVEFIKSGLGESLHDVYSSDIVNIRIPDDFRVIDFKDLPPHLDPQLSEINSYLESLKENYRKGTGLYLYGGGKGTGKSSLMCHALIQTQRYKNPRYTALFSTYQDFLDIAKQKFGNEEALEPYYAAQVLGLDEVYESGKEDLDNIAALTRLIKHRSNNRVPTFITSNYTPKEFRAVYGERADSVLEGSKYLQIEFTGEDIRKVL